MLGLIEQKQASRIITANVIENDQYLEKDTENLKIGHKLLILSEDLDNIWHGAVY